MDQYFRRAGYSVSCGVLEDGIQVTPGWVVFDASGQIEGDEGYWHPTRMAVWRWWRDRVAAHQDDEEFAQLVRKGCERGHRSAHRALEWANGKGENIPDLVRSYYRMRESRGSRRPPGWIKRAPEIARSAGFALGPEALVRRACRALVDKER